MVQYYTQPHSVFKRRMASGYSLPPPAPLEIHDHNAAEKWKKFRLAWENYALATELNKKTQPVQVATLMTVIGEDAREVCSTFTNWDEEGDDKKIAPVLKKLGEYCEARKNIPFERYRFNRCVQELGETYDEYRTTLRKLAEGCNFEAISPEEILCDRLLFGIRDNKVRERLLREKALTLAKTDEICRASESTTAQMKLMEHQTDPSSSVNAVRDQESKNIKVPRRPKPKGRVGKDDHKSKECWNCGTAHNRSRKELCPAFGKKCLKCGKPSHFAAKCPSKKRDNNASSVRAVNSDSDQEVFYADTISAVDLDDSQLVTLKLESGNYLRFQPDTGAQCNVIPVSLYRIATKDYNLERVTPAKAQLAAYGRFKTQSRGQRQNHSLA